MPRVVKEKVLPQMSRPCDCGCGKIPKRYRIKLWTGGYRTNRWYSESNTLIFLSEKHLERWIDNIWERLDEQERD